VPVLARRLSRVCRDDGDVTDLMTDSRMSSSWLSSSISSSLPPAAEATFFLLIALSFFLSSPASTHADQHNSVTMQCPSCQTCFTAHGFANLPQVSYSQPVGDWVFAVSTYLADINSNSIRLIHEFTSLEMTSDKIPVCRHTIQVSQHIQHQPASKI